MLNRQQIFDLAIAGHTLCLTLEQSDALDHDLIKVCRMADNRCVNVQNLPYYAVTLLGTPGGAVE